MEKRITKKKTVSKKKCVVCGKAIPTSRKKTCGYECMRINAQRVKARRFVQVRSIKLAERRQARAEAKIKPVKKTIMTDAEQLEINRTVDNRYGMKLETVHLRPGDAGFDELAAQVIALDKISNSRYYTEDFIGRY